jgi:Na+/phosphate symporter
MKNKDILQEYIDAVVRIPKYTPTSFDSESLIRQLKEIQSQLTEGVEYKIGEEYEFSDDGKEWKKGFFTGYQEDYNEAYNHIRPLSISSEEQQAIELMEKS